MMIVWIIHEHTKSFCVPFPCTEFFSVSNTGYMESFSNTGLVALGTKFITELAA